jgi:hypothetical protein
MLVLISGSLVKKMNSLPSPMMLSKCSMYLTLQKTIGLWSFLEKKIVGVEMLLRRRNTTNLTKFHPLKLHRSSDSLEVTKRRTCEASIVKKIQIQKSRKKKQA